MSTMPDMSVGARRERVRLRQKIRKAQTELSSLRQSGTAMTAIRDKIAKLKTKLAALEGK